MKGLILIRLDQFQQILAQIMLGVKIVQIKGYLILQITVPKSIKLVNYLDDISYPSAAGN